MNETIRELRCAMNLAQTIGEQVDDVYSLGVADGIKYALEYIDEGSTEPPQSPVYNISFSDEAIAATWSVAEDTQSKVNDTLASHDAFLAHGY